MAGKGQDSNVVADLGIRIGVITDDTGLSQFVKNIQKTIDKATYKGNTKKSGFSENVKDLEAGVKRYRALLEATYKQAHKLSLTDAMGGFKKGANGEILETAKAYKKLEKGLRDVERAMNAINPTALKQSNSLRRARITAENLSEKEAFLRDPSNKFNFSDFKKAYNSITKDARNGEFDKEAYNTLKNRFNYIKRENLTKREQWDYDKYARDFEKNLHWKNFLIDNRKDVLSELLGLDAKSIRDKQIQIQKLKAFIDDTLFKKKFGAFGTDIQQGIIGSQNNTARNRIKELEREIKEERNAYARAGEKARKERERARIQQEKAEEREQRERQRRNVNANKNSFSDIRYQYREYLKNGINPFSNDEFKKGFANIDKTKLSHNQMREYERMATNMERIAKMEDKRKKDTLQTTVELQRQNSVLGGLEKKFGQLGSMARQYFNLWAVKSYLENILNITAEFERQRRALGSLINDQSRAITMFNQIKNMALNSPYTTLELTRTAKGLAAYDVEVKDLIKDTKMLGDIAAATGVDIQRLVLAYGQVKTATWLKGQEARQFSEAGVPILRALANRYSATEGREVTTKEIQERMSKRQISFEDVQASLRAMTEEGGKFYNMQETIAETVYGKIQKIKDAWQQGLEQISSGNVIGSLVHGFLDVVVKIAKNINSIIPHLLTIGAAMLVINQRGKMTMKYAEKELALIGRREMLEKQRVRWANVAKTATGDKKEHANKMSLYYGSQISSIDKKIDNQVDKTRSLQKINYEIQQNAASTSFWDKRVKVLGLTFKRLYVTAKQVLISIGEGLKSFFASNWVSLLIMGLFEVVNIIRNIGAATRQLNKDLNAIETESAKKTNDLISGFEKNAKIAVNVADGSKKQEEALSSLAQTYGEIIPLEQMSIENLKKMEGNYDSLTKQIELYQKIQEGKEKRSTIIESDKYKNAFKEDAVKRIYYGEANFEGYRQFVDSDTSEEIQQKLLPEIQDELIRTPKEYRERFQEELAKRGFTVSIDDIKTTKKFDEAMEKIQEEASTLAAKQKMYGVTGQQMIADQKKRNKVIAEELDNVKTGNAFFEKRNEIVEEYAATMDKNLSKQITKEQAIAYLQGKMTAEEILKANQIDKNKNLYDKTLNTMTEMKSQMFGLFDGVNIYSERVERVAELWKDQYITMKDMMVLLKNGDSITVDNFRKDRSSKKEAKQWLEDLRNQPTLQESYGKSKEEINALLNMKNKADAEAYVRRYGINVDKELKKEKERKERLQKLEEEYNKKISNIENNSIIKDEEIKKGFIDAATLEYNAKKSKEDLNKEAEWRLRTAQTTTFYGLGYLDDPKSSGGSGESRIGKWKREMNEWIGVLDKARQHYKELGDLFFDETALKKTVKAYEKQFKMYEGQFMDIMKQVNITSLGEWISTEENYVKGLEAIIAKVDEEIAKASGKDLKDLQEFKFSLSQKISDEQIKNIKEAIKRFMEEVERQMEAVSGRIDIWNNIFEKTNNTHLADMFAKTFSGSGSKDAIKTMRNGFETLISKALELKDKDLDKYGREILDKVTKMFNSNVIDFSGIETLISNPQIPIEVRSQMLKIFKEFKQANQQILESGLEYYQKSRTLEEQRVDIYVKAQQKINEISKMQISDKLKDKVIGNVLKGLRSQMADLELEAIKSSDIYLTLFNNIEHAGVSSLKMLRDQIEALKDSFKDDPVKLKALNSELKKIDDQLEPKQYKFSDIFKIPSVKELKGLLSEIDEANAKVRASREKTDKLQKARQEVENKREAERSSKEADEMRAKEKKRILDEMPLQDGKVKPEQEKNAEEAANKIVDAGIDERYKSELDSYDQKIGEQINITEGLIKESNKKQRKLLEAEMRRIKAIEQMSKRIEEAFQFSSNLLDFGSSVAQSMTANAIFKGKNSDSNMMNVYANDVQSAFSAVKEYNNAFKGVMDSALNLWKGISGVIADKNGREAINDRAPVDRNTSALLELTNAIYDWRNMLTGQSTPDNFVQAYNNDQYRQKVDEKGKIDGKMIASMGLSAGISAINMIGSGDYRSGSKGLMSSVGGGLMSTGDPTMMAIGGALQLGSAIWDAADKIHDSDIEKAIDNLGEKFEELSDIITATNNKIRKSTGNEVIAGKRENIQTQQMQVKNLEQQLKLAKSKKSSSDEEIKSYEKRIKELKQSIESAEMDLFESILGSGIDEYMKNLIGIFEDAAKSGENTFKALKNSFGETLSSMVQDTIMTTIIKNRLQKFFEQVEQISKQGGMGIGMTDDIIATGLEAMEDVNSDLKNMQPLISRINTAFRVNSSTAGSLASGVKGMSEETAGQMSGYLIANFDRLGEIQKSVFTIEKAISGNTASGMMTQYQQDAITHLAQIEANTLRNANKVDQFYSLIDSMKVVNTSGSGAVYGIQTVN